MISLPPSLARRSATLVLALVLGAGVGYTGAVAAEAGFDIVKAIESASTPADHQKIAAYYDDEAKDLEAKIATHKRMAEAYHGQAHLHQLGLEMKRHCETLITQYETLAKENRDMATAHRGAQSDAAKP